MFDARRAQAIVRQSAAGRVAALAPELDLLSFLLAVFTAELPVGSAFFDHAFA
jgi:hypothetical protein